jgi:L-fuculose-phosphate aldolase
MTEAQLIKVYLKENEFSRDLKPTSDLKIHLAVYEERPDVKAIVHAHPQKATKFAIAGGKLPVELTKFGKVGIVEYSASSKKEVSDEVRKCIKEADALLFINHGVLTLGDSPTNAYRKMYTLESAATKCDM